MVDAKIDVPAALLKPAMWLGIAGFIASAVVHMLALGGSPSPFGPATWLLHLGVFIVWLPAVLVNREFAKAAPPTNGWNAWQAMYAACPVWVRIAAPVIFVYAIVNFVVFLSISSGYPKGEVPDVVEFRGFSGHWMLFYFAGAATIYSAIQRVAAAAR